MSRVQVKQVWKAFGARSVLERISLDVASGSFVTMVGASGCGKTTFLRILLGVETPTRGGITVDGTPLPPEPGRNRGIVFQRYSVFPHLTVLGNVTLGLEFAQSPRLGRLFGQAREQARTDAAELLREVGLGHVLDAWPASLSGGMQQRLAIAQALIMKPRVLLLDDQSIAYQYIMYGKGALVFKLLRDTLGAAKFDQLLKTYLAEFRGKSASIDDLEKLATRIAGQPMRYFFARWVEGTSLTVRSVTTNENVPQESP